MFSIYQSINIFKVAKIIQSNKKQRVPISEPKINLIEFFIGDGINSSFSVKKYGVIWDENR